MTRRRKDGTNLRALGLSPRQLATNPGAGTARDARRVDNIVRRALQRLHDGGDAWCETCGDEGVTDTGAGFGPCHDHRTMTSREAYTVLAAPQTTDQHIGRMVRDADRRRKRERWRR